MGENEIDWDETELIHVAACALALGGEFFQGLTSRPATADFVSSKAIEVAKLIIAKARQPDGEMYTLAALRNSGVDVECGACMEVAFTSATTNAHTCERFSGRLDSVAFTTASEAHAAGVPVFGAAGAGKLAGDNQSDICGKCGHQRGLHYEDGCKMPVAWWANGGPVREVCLCQTFHDGCGVATGQLTHCLKTPVSNVDSSLVVACGLPNGHDGRCDFTRQIIPSPTPNDRHPAALKGNEVCRHCQGDESEHCSYCWTGPREHK